MKLRLSILLLLFFLIFQANAVEICGQWEMVASGDLMAQNNIWNASTAQCISVNGSSFTVTQSNHNTSTSGSPASYPSFFKGCHWEDCTSGSGMPIQVSQIQSATINWAVTLASGTFNVTTEAWFKRNSTPGEPDGAELMIWINHQGSIQPGGSQIGTANIAGYTWQVWYASIGWNFITYKINSPLTSVNLDYRPFIDDAISRGYVQSSWYMMDIEAGFEIWQGGTGLAVNNFSASINQGTSTTAPTPDPTAGPTTAPTPAVTPAPTSPPQNIGDVNNNGSVDIVDALLIAQYFVGLDPQNFDVSKADANCNGSVDIVDSLLVAQFYVGLISRFC